MNTKKINILFIVRDNGGCGFYRCIQPASFLNRSGLANASFVLGRPSPQQLLDADLVVMQDTGSVEASNIAGFLSTHNIPFMVEFDDFIHHVSPHNLGGWSAYNPATLWVYRSMELARKAAGMTVSTPQLAREYFPYNQNIYVVPNYLDKDKWDLPISRKADGKIRIGWCGGNAHADDLHMIAGVVDRIVKEYDGRVIFETMGMERQELLGVFPMKTFDSECPSCGYEGHMHNFSAEALDTYPQAIAAHGWDIVVAPVINNAFGNCKSDLKIKEYSAVGYPVVASDVVPYREAQRAGAPVKLAETYNEWYGALKQLIDSADVRAKYSRATKDWSEKNWIQDHIKEQFEAYSNTLNRYLQMHGPKRLLKPEGGYN